MSARHAQGRIHSLNVSDGGVPKHAVEQVEVLPDGLAEDRQQHVAFHGGPERAVSLLGLDVIERLQAEGHPIAPGSTGENVTLAGLDWASVAPGTRFGFEGGVQLEAVSYASPCGQIRASFHDGGIQRLAAERHPGQARLYARVLVGGRLRRGEVCTLRPATEA